MSLISSGSRVQSPLGPFLFFFPSSTCCCCFVYIFDVFGVCDIYIYISPPKWERSHNLSINAISQCNQNDKKKGEICEGIEPPTNRFGIYYSTTELTDLDIVGLQRGYEYIYTCHNSGVYDGINNIDNI